MMQVEEIYLVLGVVPSIEASGQVGFLHVTSPRATGAGRRHAYFNRL